jgi:hypothetical protein
MQQRSDVEGTERTVALEKHSIGSSDTTFFSEPLANGSLSALGYSYPLHSRI